MSQRRKHATPTQKDLSSEDHECHDKIFIAIHHVDVELFPRWYTNRLTGQLKVYFCLLTVLYSEAESSPGSGPVVLTGKKAKANCGYNLYEFQ